MSIEELKAMPYPDYLRTAHWMRTREWVLIFWDRRCAVCDSGEAPEVHHRTSARRGAELLTDCIVLCDDCHELFHGGANGAG